MSWVSEAANAVADGASDGAGAVGDQWDSTADALADPDSWLGGDAAAAWDAFEDGTADLLDTLLDSLGQPLADVIDLDDVFSFVEHAGTTIPDQLADVAAATLGAIPERYTDQLSRVAEPFDDLLADIDRVYRDAVDGVLRRAAAMDLLLQDALSGLSAAIDHAAQLLELLPRMLERLLYFLERVVRCLVDLVAMLGGCAGGVVGYYVWKASVVAANALRPIRPIPRKLQDFLQPVFPEFRSYPNAWLGWHNIWLVDDAWVGGSLGTTFAGVTYKGIRFSSVVYVSPPLDMGHYGHVSNIAHELEHVRQMLRFVSEPLFACAYGAGWAVGGGYRQNPFERAAFELECRQRSRILQWVNHVGANEYENPCDKISKHNPCTEGFR